VSSPQSSLRLNVGFIAHQTVGYSRDFFFELERIHLPPDLVLKNLKGCANFTRTTQGLVSKLSFSGSADMTCARCLDAFPLTLNIDSTELYVFATHAQSGTDLIFPENGWIDLFPIVRDYMYLEIPINPICQEDCKGLCPICGKNLNQNACNHETEATDSRLAILKSLLDE